MSGLLPCPFCGLSAKYEYGEDWYDITCLCGYSFSHSDRCMPGESEKDAMIRSWNTRGYTRYIQSIKGILSDIIRGAGYDYDYEEIINKSKHALEELEKINTLRALEAAEKDSEE